MHARVSDKLAQFHKECVKEHNDDALLRWRMTWKRHKAFLQLASEQMPIDFILTKQECGRPCMSSKYVSFTFEMSSSASKLSLCTGRIFPAALEQAGPCTKI